MMLKVLLLEDDPNKKQRLLEFLNSKKGELFDRVDTVICVGDALNALNKYEYDLLIADVIVPAVLGGIAHEEHSITLFHQIDEAFNLIPPRFAIAISASSELTASAREFFVGRPWGILPYLDHSNECMATIEKVAAYIIVKSKVIDPQSRCDICIVTALADPEFSAIEALAEWDALEPIDETQFVRMGRIEVGGENRTVCAAFAPRMGPVATATLVAKLVLKLRPSLLVMCGICAGLPSKTSIGDVVAADISWDWQSGKYVDRAGQVQFEIAPHQIAINEKVRAQLLVFKKDVDFWKSLAVLAAEMKQHTPKLVIGPIATGSAVLADSRVAERIRTNQHRNVAGLDMEVYGAYAAAIQCDPNLLFVALKSVCDQGDLQKNDLFQEYAARISARAAMKFIRDYAAPFFCRV